MAEVKSKTQGKFRSERNVQPYPASWIDIFTAWVSQLPGEGWMYYLGFAVILIGVQVALMWIEDSATSGTILPIQVFMPAVFAFFLTLFQYLDGRAASAMEILRPALQVEEEKYQELKYSISTLPRVRTLLAGLLVLGITLIIEYLTGSYFPEALIGLPLSIQLWRGIYIISWVLFGTFLYHTIHQLRLINHIYIRYTRIDLFSMMPYHAFSNLSALTAGSLTMIIYGWLYVNPIMKLDDPVVFGWVVSVLLTAAITFVLPQLGIHRLQVEEKDRLLNEAYQRLQTIILEMHQHIDDKDLDGMGKLNVAYNSLEQEINTLKRIPTWPWEPETIQMLVTALALPLGLWIIQYILELVFSS